MPRRSISNSKVSDFELRRKNPVELGFDSNLEKDSKPLRIGGIATNLSFSLDTGESIAQTNIEGGLVFDFVKTDFLETPIVSAGGAVGVINFEVYDTRAFQMDYNVALPLFKLKSVLDSNDWSEFETFDYNGSLKIQTVEGASDTGLAAKILINSNNQIGFKVLKAASDYSASGQALVKFEHGAGSHGIISMQVEDEFNFKADDNAKIEAKSGDVKLDASTGITRFLLDGDTDDLCTLTVAANGATTIATADSDGTVGHLTIAPNGDLVLDPDSNKIIVNATDDLYFDGGGNTYITESSADVLKFYVGGDVFLSMAEYNLSGNVVNISGASCGFTQKEPTFDATDTDVEFIFSNKQKLTLTDNCTDIHFRFPNVSGNFVWVLLQDGTGGRTISNWKTKDISGNAGAGNSGLVLWAGGSAPLNTETADKADIVSIYWDADNEIAYGTYTYNF